MQQATLIAAILNKNIVYIMMLTGCWIVIPMVEYRMAAMQAFAKKPM